MNNRSYNPPGLAERVYRIINANGLGPKEFGDRVGASRQRVNNWLNGTNGVPIDIAVRIKSEFGITLDWLYTGDASFMPLSKAGPLGLTENDPPKK
jgi:transcriptional regulator with XRE-family HTH domain